MHEIIKYLKLSMPPRQHSLRAAVPGGVGSSGERAQHFFQLRGLSFPFMLAQPCGLTSRSGCKNYVQHPRLLESETKMVSRLLQKTHLDWEMQDWLPELGVRAHD